MLVGPPLARLKRRVVYVEEQAVPADELPVLFLSRRSRQVLPHHLQGLVASPFAGPWRSIGTWHRGQNLIPVPWRQP
jgi:hypothetical protein